MNAPGTVVETEDLRGRSGRERPAWLRISLWIAGILIFCAALEARIGRFGFAPTDQGFILAQSWRILQGEIPHVDVVSVRPLGSAILHTIDFALPAPLFVASGFLATVELAVATVALAAFLLSAAPTSWGPWRIALVVAAGLANLHSYPAMAWHTIDGIFFVSVGLWQLERGFRTGSSRSRRLGLLCLGCAVVIKQSYAAAVPIGLLLLFAHPASTARSARRWRGTLADLVVLGAAPLAYFGFVTLKGGLPAALDQLTGGRQTWGENLYEFWTSPGPFAAPDIRLVIGLAVVTAALVAVTARATGRLRWVRLAAAVATGALMLWSVYRGGFERSAPWSLMVLWVFLVVTVMHAVVRRRLPWRQLLVVALAWMASLSWGSPYPTLIAGSMALGVLDMLAGAVADVVPKRTPPVVASLAGVLVVVLVGTQVVAAHDRAPYSDRSQGDLTADLGDVAAPMRWTRTNPSVHTYVGQLRDCLARFPAANVTILPDDAFAYPVFKLHNPFPVDWPIPDEMVGDARQRTLDTARRLDRTGDYLVLFQAFGSDRLTRGEPVYPSVPPEIGTVGHSDIEQLIRESLTGRKISCGSLAGVWAPAPR
ncbi:hypothetical protein [Amycolatopsis sp. NPDC004378]